MRKNEQTSLVLPVRPVSMEQLGVPVESTERWDTPFEGIGRNTRLLYMLDPVPGIQPAAALPPHVT